MKKKSKALPTHADELDCLRLHKALVQANEAKQASLAAASQFALLLAAAEKKYGFVHVDGEGIDLDTRVISRKPRGD
jgi:hypothetical protein